MIQHMVSLKFKPDTSEDDIRTLEQMLEALPDRIVEIHTYEFGRDIVGSERSFDFGLVSLFANVEALRRYQEHPEHQKVIRHIQTVCDRVVTVDFPYEYAPREDVDLPFRPPL